VAIDLDRIGPMEAARSESDRVTGIRNPGQSR
jgi:hypothetical protein